MPQLLNWTRFTLKTVYLTLNLFYKDILNFKQKILLFY